MDDNHVWGVCYDENAQQYLVAYYEDEAFARHIAERTNDKEGFPHH